MAECTKVIAKYPNYRDVFIIVLHTYTYLYICYDIVFSLLVLFAFCSLEFSGVSQFTFSHTLLPPLLLQLECALNFILVHSTLTNYFDKYSTMCVCVCVRELIADCTQNAN